MRTNINTLVNVLTLQLPQNESKNVTDVRDKVTFLHPDMMHLHYFNFKLLTADEELGDICSQFQECFK